MSTADTQEAAARELRKSQVFHAHIWRKQRACRRVFENRRWFAALSLPTADLSAEEIFEYSGNLYEHCVPLWNDLWLRTLMH